MRWILRCALDGLLLGIGLTLGWAIETYRPHGTDWLQTTLCTEIEQHHRGTPTCTPH
jgi:hypothetical protein